MASKICRGPWHPWQWSFAVDAGAATWQPRVSPCRRSTRQRGAAGPRDTCSCARSLDTTACDNQPWGGAGGALPPVQSTSAAAAAAVGSAAAARIDSKLQESPAKRRLSVSHVLTSSLLSLLLSLFVCFFLVFLILLLLFFGHNENEKNLRNTLIGIYFCIREGTKQRS